VPKDKLLRRETNWAALPEEFGWELKSIREGDEPEVLEAPGAVREELISADPYCSTLI
jgi:hypothetical protein